MQKFYNPNSFFGWLNSLRILPTNAILGSANRRTLCPPIIHDPTLGQVVKNWNLADTGAFITIYFLGLLYSKRVTSQMESFVYINIKRTSFFHISNMMLGLAVYVGLFNSSNRLEGHVPNGLTWDIPEATKLKKYDYTSDMIKRNPFLRWLVPVDL